MTNQVDAYEALENPLLYGALMGTFEQWKKQSGKGAWNGHMFRTDSGINSHRAVQMAYAGLTKEMKRLGPILGDEVEEGVKSNAVMRMDDPDFGHDTPVAVAVDNADNDEATRAACEAMAAKALARYENGLDDSNEGNAYGAGQDQEMDEGDDVDDDEEDGPRPQQQQQMQRTSPPPTPVQRFTVSPMVSAADSCAVRRCPKSPVQSQRHSVP